MYMFITLSAEVLNGSVLFIKMTQYFSVFIKVYGISALGCSDKLSYLVNDLI